MPDDGGSKPEPSQRTRGDSRAHPHLSGNDTEEGLGFEPFLLRASGPGVLFHLYTNPP